MKKHIKTLAFSLMIVTISVLLSAGHPYAANNALTFDGTDDIVDVGDIDSLDGASQYTVEAWVRFASFTANTTVFAKRTSDSDRALVLQCYDGGGNMGMAVSSGYGYTSSPLSLNPTTLFVG